MSTNLKDYQFTALDQPPDWEIHTVDGVFIKQMHMPKKMMMVPQHVHQFDHVTLLARGSVRAWKDGELMGDFVAPAAIYIEKGLAHHFLSLEDETIAYCIHNLHGKSELSVLAEADPLVKE